MVALTLPITAFLPVEKRQRRRPTPDGRGRGISRQAP